MLGPAEGDLGTVRLRNAITARTVPRRAVLGALIASELIVLYLMLDGGSWVYDDNLILGLAGQSGLNWSWLTSPLFEHWGIGYHFVFSGVHALMPIDYRWALAGMLALLGGSTYLVDRSFCLLFGGRWLGLMAAAYFGLSVLFIRQLQWFASGLQAVPTTFFDLLCLYAYLRFTRDGSRRWVVVAAAALAAGFLFYEKPAYMLLYLVLLRLLFMSPDMHLRELARTLWRERLMWGALTAVTAVWAIAYVHYGGSSALSSGSVTVSQYLQFFRILWLQSLVPALVGATLPQTGLSAAQIALVVALQLIVVLAVAFSLHRKPSAWRAWLYLAIAVLVNGLLVARARVPFFGVDVAGDLRYLLDFAWVAPMCVCFAFISRPVLWPQAEDRRVPLGVRFSARPAGAAAAIALMAYFAIALATTAKLQREWLGQAARSWEQNVQSGLARFETASRRPVLADGIAPPFIVASAFYPYDLLSRIVPLYDRRAQVDGVLDGPLVLLDPAGGVHRAAVASQIGSGTMSALLRSGQLVISSAIRVVPQTDDVCVSAGSRPATITRRELDAPASAAQPYYLWSTYSARRARQLPLFVDPGSGFPRSTDRSLPVAGGPSSSILFLDSPSPRRLRLVLVPGSTVCLSRFAVVTLGAVS